MQVTPHRLAIVLMTSMKRVRRCNLRETCICLIWVERACSLVRHCLFLTTRLPSNNCSPLILSHKMTPPSSNALQERDHNVSYKDQSTNTLDGPDRPKLPSHAKRTSSCQPQTSHPRI